MSRPRNRYLGSYDSRPTRPLDLPFTVGNLRALLQAGATGSGNPTHQQIADWADRYVIALYLSDEPGPGGREVGPDDLDIDVAMDVWMQWDLSLINMYALPELQSLNFAEVRMPEGWFEGWLARLGAPSS